jgi:serine/threonine protein kinase
VYLADDCKTGQPVALKLPRLEVLLDPEKRKRFRVEANVLEKLNHPGIVKVHESDASGPVPFIATQWCDGPDLCQWLTFREEDGLPLPGWRDVVELMASVADALEYAHGDGIAHRDLKPANILLSSVDTKVAQADGLGKFRPRITDFGLAKLNEIALADSRSSLMIGTPMYMAPERLCVREYSDGMSEMERLIAGDIYSLGAILFELLTGKPALAGATYLQLLDGSATPMSLGRRDASQEIPDSLNSVVSVCFERNPQARYASAADFAADLRRCASGQPIVGRPQTVGRRCGYWILRHDWLAISGWFAIVSQSMLATWLILSDLFKVPFGLLSAQEYTSMLPQLVVIALTTSLMPILVGAFCVRGKRWAPWLGAALASVNVSAPLIALFDRPPLFGDIYDSNEPYFTFQIHLVIAMTFFVQLALYGITIWIDLRHRRTT